MRYIHAVIYIDFECTVLTSIYTSVTTTQSRYRHFHYPRNFPHTSLQSIPHPLRQHPSNFYHSRLVLPVLELHRNEILSVFLCIWFLWLNIMFLRFTHVVARTSRLFLILAKYSSLYRRTIMYPFTCCGHLDFFQFCAILNKAVMNIPMNKSFCVHMFLFLLANI